jgi:ATPase family associated with various cellular activities (AAA)
MTNYTETHSIIFTKPAQRQLRDKVIASNMTALLASTNNKSLSVRGWTIDADATPEGTAWTREDNPTDDGYIYRMFVRATFTRDDGHAPGKTELASIARTMATRSSQPAFGKWTLTGIDDDTYTPVAEDDLDANVADIGYTETDIPEDWDAYFTHLFGLGSHIKRVRKALEAGMSSEWRNRFHCALIGPPGCGKSDICRSIKDALGEDAVIEFDGTATTAAGAIKELAELEILPRVIVIEEIEKAPEATMQFLLGVLDLRAEIRKTTARGNIQRNTKLFCIATVNNEELFEKLQAGALASRFTNKIHFDRPSRETLSLILTREIAKVEGSEKWIGPTLDYCDAHGITDPRQVIAIALCGGDDLLTGEYQAMLEETE